MACVLRIPSDRGFLSLKGEFRFGVDFLDDEIWKLEMMVCHFDWHLSREGLAEFRIQVKYSD